MRRGFDFVEGAAHLYYAGRRRLGIDRNPELEVSGFEVAPDVAAAKEESHSDLAALFFAHEGRRIHKWTHYLGAYEELFSPYRAGFPLPDGTTRPLGILEIGVSEGGSLQLWRKYFGPEARIWGVDWNPNCAKIDDPDVEIRIGSQADRTFLESVVRDMGGVDIVLDDGSHGAGDQRSSLEILFPLLSVAGLYVVEDLHTSYWSTYGGGYRRPGAFIELTKAIVDDLHRWYHGRPNRSPIDASASVSRITIYDSMVAIKKAHRGRPTVTKVGEPSF
jgi:hypothetical protein